MKQSPRWWLLGIGVAAFVLSACSGHQTVDLDMKTLFTLSIGKAENQLDMLELAGVPSSDKTRIYMRDGLFFISNGASDKVMEFSSYGDILSLLYNPADNPEPYLLQANMTGSEIATREAHPYPLNNVGEVAEANDKMLLVEDEVPQERQEYDKNLSAMLSQIVLRFHANGTYSDYIGQEGVGGTPFPYIERIQTNAAGEMIIICRTQAEWIVYWYSPDGELLYRVDIGLKNLPLPAAEGYVASLETIFADPDKRLLYLKLDYYKQEKSAGARDNVDFFKSSVYWLDVDAQKYAGHIDLPKHVEDQSNDGVIGTKSIDVLYQFLGVARGGYLFFLSPLQNDDYELLVLDKSGLVIRRSRIVLDDKDIAFRNFYLAPSGVLSALLVHDFSASIVWWRSDKLIEGLRLEAR